MSPFCFVFVLIYSSGRLVFLKLRQKEFRQNDILIQYLTLGCDKYHLMLFSFLITQPLYKRRKVNYCYLLGTPFREYMFSLETGSVPERNIPQRFLHWYTLAGNSCSSRWDHQIFRWERTVFKNVLFECWDFLTSASCSFCLISWQHSLCRRLILRSSCRRFFSWRRLVISSVASLLESIALVSFLRSAVVSLLLSDEIFIQGLYSNRNHVCWIVHNISRSKH